MLNRTSFAQDCMMCGKLPGTATSYSDRASSHTVYRHTFERIAAIADVLRLRSTKQLKPGNQPKAPIR